MHRAYPDIDTAWARLATYLGHRFQPELTNFETLRSYLDREWHQLTPRFYEHSVGYLYDLTHFHHMGVKASFFDFMLGFADELAITDLADIGCGIGLDAQTLLQAGYQVHGYDLDNPSLAYARWRIDHDLGVDTQLRTVDQLTGRRHQLAYAVDVIGHTDDPARLAKMMLASADYVCLNLGPHDGRHRHGAADLHPSLDHQRILAELTLHGDLIRLGAADQNVVTL
jgi:SAM-dependent methyltransferase